ncbi:MAG: TatD family deoxyribonuclease [Planctomycetota bacterium]|nr:MAG: TatD family deoxyribonuclease [Planctomycetota bacterium]
MIDTHCHLTFPQYEGRVAGVLADARAAGVTGAVTVSTTTRDCLAALDLARAHDRLWCTAGVHPLYADGGRDGLPHVWDNLRLVASDPACVAWGELGLDNHYDRPPRDLQRAVLGEQLDRIGAWMESDGLDLPVVLHCREAFSDLIPILRDGPVAPERHVFHCFTGTPEDARAVLDFGAWISFTGVVTFANASAVRDAARLVPADRLMVETDAPFLTPEPHRKVRPNEPKFVADTARFLAELRGEDWDSFHAQINDNTRRFFGIDAQ